MRKLFVISVCVLSLSAEAQVSAPGYYKDVFMESGSFLTSRTDLPATDYLGLSLEYFVSERTPANNFTGTVDSIMQSRVFVGSEIDENGVLLYPDGAPRFRVIYVNGGRATKHGGTMGETGRERIREFVAAGGSYVGSCAGAYLTSTGSVNKSGKVSITPEYYALFPRPLHSTGLEKSFTAVMMEKDSPLLKYRDFGPDLRIDSVRHNGGNYLIEDNELPKETEIHARYLLDGYDVKQKIDGKPCVWSYKKDIDTGRVLACGSHPEGVTEGKRLDLFSSFLLYAMDGNGAVRIKGDLTPGMPWNMDKFTRDNDPLHTAIGDMQVHHFTLQVPAGTEELSLELKGQPGWEDVDLFLMASPDEITFLENSKFREISHGTDKVLKIDSPKAGCWHVSVMCNTTVESSVNKYGVQYSGKVEVLNGVPYSLTANCK